MPTLEILDLSKNQLEGFPDSPGSLHNLKVLSLTSNHIYSLPSYLKDFTHLKVFKVAHNPIEWPVSRAALLGQSCIPDVD
jgi:Leucine-rich repeat (LRR) protein